MITKNKLFLVRHGECAGNRRKILNGHLDTPLTGEGCRQARESALQLKDKGIDVMYTSPLQRTTVTGGIIARSIGLPVRLVRPHAKLIERDFGVFTGKPIAEALASCRPGNLLVTAKVTYFLEADRAENFPTLYDRAKGLLREVKAAHPAKNVVLVTHGDIGIMIWAAYYNLDWREALITRSFDNCQILELPGSLM